jgi:hypothetical protein
MTKCVRSASVHAAGTWRNATASAYWREQSRRSQRQFLFWWQVMDSNHRRLSRRFYSPCALLRIYTS